MKSLSKKQIAEKTKICNGLKRSLKTLEKDFFNFEKEIQKLRDDLQSKIDLFNAKVGKADNFITEITGLAEEYYDGQSEKWKDSKEGLAYKNWVWGQLAIDLDGIEVVDHYYGEFEPIKLECLDIQNLENTPNKP